MRKLASLFIACSLLLGVTHITAETPNSGAAGNFTIHAKVPGDWAKAHLYAWTGETKYLGEWPGQAMSKNNDWYDLEVDKATRNVIVNNGENDPNKKQTEDVSVTGETWLVLANVENGKYKVKSYNINPNNKITVRVKVPDNWQNPSIWAWRGENGNTENVYAQFPGEALVKEADSKYYKHELPAWVTGIVISYKNSDNTVQTKNITVEANKNVWLTVKDTNDIDVSYTEPKFTNKHTVTFDTGGGQPMSAVEVEHGVKLSKPADPQKEGHIFTGWYINPDTDTNSFDFANTPINEDITLKATWEAENHTVTFKYEDTKTTDLTEQVVYGQKITAPTQPTRDGFTFKGWFEKEGANYKEEAFNFTTAIKKDIVLYAKWEQNSSPTPPAPTAKITATVQTRKLSGDFVLAIKDETGNVYPTGTAVVIVYATDKTMATIATGDSLGTCIFPNSTLPTTELVNQTVTVRVQRAGETAVKEYQLTLTIPAKQAKPALQADKVLEVVKDSNLATLNLKDQAAKFDKLSVDKVKEIKILGKENGRNNYTQLDTRNISSVPESAVANITYIDNSQTSVNVMVKIVAKTVTPTPNPPTPSPTDKLIIPYVPSGEGTKDIERLNEVRLLDKSEDYYVVGSNEPLAFRFAASPENLLAVYLDGTKLSPELYTVRKGSTIINLAPSLLNKLTQGKHTLTSTFLRFGDVKKGTANFYVVATNKRGQVGKTGELASQSAAFTFVMSLLAISLAKSQKH